MMNPNEIAVLKRHLPYPLILIMIMLFFPMFIVEPVEQELQAVTSQYDGQTKKARSLRSQRAEIDVSNQKFSNLKEIRDQALRVIPAESELPDIIERLVKLAANNFVAMDDVRYNLLDSYEGMNAPAFDIHMSLVASYDGMRAFLADVESIENPMIITEIVVVEGNRYSLNFKQLVK